MPFFTLQCINIVIHYDAMKKYKLNESLLLLKNKKEVDEFLRDLCTPAERKALEERWAVAQCLYDSKLSYRDIASKLKTSTTTVTRVARFLTNEPYKGYQKILKRINKWIKD